MSIDSLYTEARERGALFDLTGHARWRLSGADRVRYLNGQVTNDIRRLHPGASMAACVTTAKGRLCGLVQVAAGADHLRLDAEGELRETLGARLERYIIADDVILEDITDETSQYHLIAPGSPGIGETARRFGRPGWDIVVPRADGLPAGLVAGYVAVPPELAEALRIEAGVPRWGAELTEETLPPEAGLDEWAVDYHKGCYIGQEVISRIKSVGRVNRRLAGIVSATPLVRGMTLHDGDTPAGVITSAAWSPGLRMWAALGYLKRGAAAATARSADASAEIDVRALPLVNG